MAYLRSIKYGCQVSGCLSGAVQQLVSFRNEEMGTYCRRHAAEALKRQKRVEAEIFEDQRRLREEAG